jgi:hypothetical protein
MCRDGSTRLFQLTLSHSKNIKVKRNLKFKYTICNTKNVSNNEKSWCVTTVTPDTFGGIR